MQDIFNMAGYYTAHAIWSVADGETLIPILGYLGADNRRSMERLVMGSAVAFARAETQLSSLAPDTRGAVFVKDALVHLETGKTDALVVEIAFAHMGDARPQVLIPYRHATNPAGFAVHCLQVTRLGGIPKEEINSLMNAFVAGIDSHEQGGKLFRERYVSEAGETAGPYARENPEFSAEDYELLKRSPLLVFLMVAAADGNVDEKELASFVKGLLSDDNLRDKLLNRIVTNIIGQVPAMMLKMVSERIDFISELSRVRTVVEQNLAPAEADAFKQSLLSLGNGVAAASGGFLGLGRVGREEKQALKSIAACLGIAGH